MNHPARPMASKILTAAVLTAALVVPGLASASAFLEITLRIDDKDRPAAAAVYTEYKQPFLTTIEGAEAKNLLVRDDDVQVLHRFTSSEQASAYLHSDLFNNDVVVALKPLLQAPPEVRIYSAD